MKPGGLRRRTKKAARRSVAWLTTYSALAPLWYRLGARTSVRILAYHAIADEPDNPFSVSEQRFRDQIALLKQSYTVVSLSECFKDLNEGIERPNRVVLTFDDGYRDFYKSAYPILREAGLPATCFVIGGMLQSNSERYLTIEQIDEMLQSGLIELGSHSLTHRSLAELSDDECAQEIEESKRLLEGISGSTIRFFCYPYGTFNDIDRRCEPFLRRAGYDAACTSINGVNRTAATPYRLRRTKIEGSDDIRTFSRILKGALDAWILVDFFLRSLQRRRQFAPGRP